MLGPAPLFRLKGRERAQLVVKASDRARAAVRAVREAVEAVAGRSRGPRASTSRSTWTRSSDRTAELCSVPVADEHVDAEDEDLEELEEVPQLDPEAAARRSAAMSFIRKWGDPVLKSRATPVDRFDDTLRQQVQRMAGIMKDAIGVGLAAPQLGISQRLLVYRIGSDAPLITLINPEFEWTSDDAGDLRGGLPVDPRRRGRRGAARSTSASARRTSTARSGSSRRPGSRRA